MRIKWGSQLEVRFGAACEVSEGDRVGVPSRFRWSTGVGERAVDEEKGKSGSRDFTRCG